MLKKLKHKKLSRLINAFCWEEREFLKRLIKKKYQIKHYSNFHVAYLLKSGLKEEKIE
jgi:hypothetical protein